MAANILHSTWQSWTALHEPWRFAVVLSLLSVNVFHEVGRCHGENEEVTKGEKGKRGGRWLRARPVKTFCLKTWPLSLELLLPTVACLPFSRHVQQQEGSFPPWRRGFPRPPATSAARHQSLTAVWSETWRCLTGSEWTQMSRFWGGGNSNVTMYRIPWKCSESTDDFYYYQLNKTTRKEFFSGSKESLVKIVSRAGRTKTAVDIYQ